MHSEKGARFGEKKARAPYIRFRKRIPRHSINDRFVFSDANRMPIFIGRTGDIIVEITEKTRVFDILQKYGDIAGVMVMFGVKPVGKYSLRRVITRVLTVKMAARIHRVPLDDFLDKLHKAVEKKSAN